MEGQQYKWDKRQSWLFFELNDGISGNSVEVKF